MAKASAYAQKIGLNVEDEAVKEAIASLDYEKMADLLIASEVPAESNTEEAQASKEAEPYG